MIIVQKMPVKAKKLIEHFYINWSTANKPWLRNVHKLERLRKAWRFLESMFIQHFFRFRSEILVPVLGALLFSLGCHVETWYDVFCFILLSKCLAWMHVRAAHGCLVPIEARRWYWSPGTIITAMWVLGIELRSSGRAASALNCIASSPDPYFF